MSHVPHRAPSEKHRPPRGQALAEYVLIVSLIVIVALVALAFFGAELSDVLSIIADTIHN